MVAWRWYKIGWLVSERGVGIPVSETKRVDHPVVDRFINSGIEITYGSGVFGAADCRNYFFDIDYIHRFAIDRIGTDDTKDVQAGHKLMAVDKNRLGANHQIGKAFLAATIDEQQQAQAKGYLM
jgi:hypothetical protein